jgi:hypothetical protein
MGLTANQLADLVIALRLRAGIADTDPRVRQAAILLRDNGSTNTTSSTVQVLDNSIVLVGNASGTDTITLSATDTLADAVADINTTADGRSAEVIGPDPDELARNLFVTPATDIRSGDVTLYVKSQLLLEQIVKAALARLERYCQTRLVDDGTTVEAVVWQDGYMIVLPDKRVNRLEFLAVDSDDGLDVFYAGSGHATVEVTDTAVILRTSVPGTATAETVITLADADSLTDVATAIGGVADWSATVLNERRNTDLVACPVQRVTDGGVRLDIWSVADGEYRIDREAGVIYVDELVLEYGGSRIGGQVRARYQAGYTALPADLEDALLTTAKAGLDAQRRDAGLASESLGDYSWSAAAGSVPAGAMDDAIRAQAEVLDTYRRMLP